MPCRRDASDGPPATREGNRAAARAARALLEEVVALLGRAGSCAEADKRAPRWPRPPGRTDGPSLPLPAMAALGSRSAGRGGKAAGLGGDLWAFQASRCLLGPPIVSPASQWGCCSRRAGPRRAPRPARARCPPGEPSMRPSARRPVRLAAGSGPARRAARVERGTPAPTVRPHPRPHPRPLLLRRRAPQLRQAGTARAAASGSHTQGPILPSSAQPYGKSASTQQPPLIQAQNVPQQGTITTLFVAIMDANGARKKNHLTPRDSQLITNHM